MARISGAVVAAGKVEVEQNRRVVQHPDGGVVAEVRVLEGTRVAAGEVLVRLDPSEITSELAIVENRLFEFSARAARLRAERDGAPHPVFDAALTEKARVRPEVADLMQGQVRLFEARSETLAQEAGQLARQKTQIASQIRGLEAQTRSFARQLALVERGLEQQRDLLARGLVNSDKVLALELDEAQLSGEIGRLSALRAEAEERMTALDIDVLRLSVTRREQAIAQLRDITAQEAELLERRLALNRRLARLDIRAPVSGAVYGLTVNTPRSVLRPADAVLYLVPQDKPPVIAARILPIHIDQVHVGQPVVLRFPGFDSRSTPGLEGRVARLSADAFTDERTQASYYRAEIHLAPGEAHKLGGKAIVPGMPVECFIRTEDRTPLAYLTQPLADYFRRAFRES